MNKNILKTGIQQYIDNNWNTDIVSVLLKKQQFQEVSQQELAEQLEAKKKCRYKLPIWFKTSSIYYPNKLHIEQTSSERTAKYKANLVGGKILLDLTGGFGIDSYFFSKKIHTIIHCELNKKLSQIAAYNHKILGVGNTSFIVGDGLEFLMDYYRTFDWIYVDPSRRSHTKEKVFLLQDCLPNIPAALNLIFKKTSKVLIKTAPLLDLSQGISELCFTKEIHVIAVKNEVKELLWVLQKNYEGEIKIRTVNLLKEGQQVFDFIRSQEKEITSKFALPHKFLYEPNAAILKSGGFKSLGNALGLKKLHEHSHLYTSSELIYFPGRSFMIKATISYTKKEIAKLNLKKANITTRNFPESVATIRKKLKINDGGDAYLFFTTELNGQLIVIHCTKV